MTETPVFLSERLRAEGEKTIQFFQDISPEQWQAIIYTEGESWTVLQVLAHFVSTEEAFQKLVANILSGGQGVAEDFSIDEYNASHVKELEGQSAPALISQFDRLRQATMTLVQGLSEQELQLQGRHPYLGMTPLVEIIKLVYRHNQIHQREMRKILAQE